MEPLFSIITVTFNAEKTIRPTVESVAKQTCTLYEHLIIDGASTDHTLEIARQYGNTKAMRILSQKDEGLYFAMNTAIEMARGDYLIFLNAGDRLHSPNTLQLIADASFETGYPGIIYGQTDIIDNDGRRIADRHLLAPPTLSLESFKDGMVVCHQSFVVLRKIAGLYNIKYRYSADYDWCIRCLQRSRRNVYIDDVLTDYLYQGLTTNNRNKSLRERFRIMSHYFGFFHTLYAHLTFIPRFLKRRKFEKTLDGNA